MLGRDGLRVRTLRWDALHQVCVATGGRPEARFLRRFGFRLVPLRGRPRRRRLVRADGFWIGVGGGASGRRSFRAFGLIDGRRLVALRTQVIA